MRGMDTSLHRPRGTASDSLMTQIHVGNVLQVHGLYASEADAIRRVLLDADWMRNIERCADDPISRDAQKLFQEKIDRIFATHYAHVMELLEAVTRLRYAAREYAFTDGEILEVFNGYREDFGLPGLPPTTDLWADQPVPTR